MKEIKQWIEDRMLPYPENPTLSQRGSYDAYLNVLNQIKIIEDADKKKS